MSRLGVPESTRHLLLTGKPGIGKSTLVKKVCDELASKGVPTSGFYTEEIRQGGQRIGFDVVTLQGIRAPLARISEGTSRQPRVGKYHVNVKSFEQSVLPVVLQPAHDDSILIIDEIGKMELLSEGFSKAVKKVFCNSQMILATVPISYNSFVQHLQSLPSTHTIEVDYSNRNSLLEHIMEVLLKSVK